VTAAGAPAPLVRALGELRPRIGRGVFLAETCAVIGDVELGDESSIWYSTVIRGDVMPIRIGARTSIQDGTVIHVTSGRFGTTIGNDCTIGHAAVIHACTVEDGCLIGIGSIILNGARIRSGSVVAAGALVAEGMEVASNTLVMGVPAKPRREVTSAEQARFREGVVHYVDKARVYKEES